MGRGLSQLQKNILGTAYTVNRYTQSGNPAVKTGNPLDGYRIPVVDYQGIKDCRTGLLIYAEGGIQPSLYIKRNHSWNEERNTGIFKGTTRHKKTKASITRAVTRLIERGLLVYAPKPRHYWGYVLTCDGFDIGKENQRDIYSIDAALELFGLTKWQGTSPNDKYYSYGERKSDLIETINTVTVT